MYIAGIGSVFGRGRGIDALTQALTQGWQPPAWRTPLATALPVYEVTPETLSDKALFKKMRRADRFSRLAVMAATDALTDSGVSLKGDKSNLGILLGTALGPHATTFKYLDDILDYGDAGPSPTLFSHSVHNAATSYIASCLGCRGPTLTVSQFALSFHHTLMLAAAWLSEGRCDYVLAGTVDECSPAMEYIVSEKVAPAADGRIHPFDFSDQPAAVPGEGALFMLLSREIPSRSYARIAEVSLCLNDNHPVAEPTPDLVIIEADGLAGDERHYQPIAAAAPVLGAYTPLFGSFICNSAFNLAVGALSLHRQTLYACPDDKNPHHLAICQKHTEKDLNRITCYKTSSVFKDGRITLEKAP